MHRSHDGSRPWIDQLQREKRTQVTSDECLLETASSEASPGLGTADWDVPPFTFSQVSGALPQVAPFVRRCADG